MYGMRSTYDPSEENGGGGMMMQQHQMMARQMPPAPRIDLSDLPAFLLQPGPRNGPVMCYIVRDRGSAKMYPKVRGANDFLFPRVSL